MTLHVALSNFFSDSQDPHALGNDEIDEDIRVGFLDVCQRVLEKMQIASSRMRGTLAANSIIVCPIYNGGAAW